MDQCDATFVIVRIVHDTLRPTPKDGAAIVAWQRRQGGRVLGLPKRVVKDVVLWMN